jgi:carnitine O-acetyltransferase
LLRIVSYRYLQTTVEGAFALLRLFFCTVAVLCKNQFYYFQALWPNTYEVAVDEYDILDILKAIQKHADALDPVEASKEALGVLTSLPRTQWAVTRNELCETEVNATALHVIDSALFVLVLDDYEETDINDAASNMLHGKFGLSDLSSDDRDCER